MSGHWGCELVGSAVQKFVREDIPYSYQHLKGVLDEGRLRGF